MAKKISAEKMARYRATAQKRWTEEQQALYKRSVAARALANKAAAMLKDEFGADSVILFGSLAHGQWFTSTSDIDLAATGIPKAEYFRAVALLQDISANFSIDLVDLTNCKPSLLESINREGIPL